MQVSDLVFIDSTGYHFADFPTFLAWLQSGYQGIYGADVYLGADSEDGQFVALVAQALYDTAALGASVYNSFSPVTSQGVGLSRLVRINGLSREIPSFSTVTLTIVGVTGTVITNGIAQDILDQQWALPLSVTIPGSGTIDVVATSLVVGFITADANTVTSIFTPTLGWQSVNNANPATAGAGVESDAALRVRQSVSTSLPAQTVFDATIGAVENLPGVTDVRGYENQTSTVGGGGSGSVSQPAHSISLVVTGGDPLAICQTILDKKTPGTDTYGSTTETVYDSKGMPLNISFEESLAAEIGVQVTITAGPHYSSDFATLIQNAVAAVINAGPIGSPVLYTTLFAPAYLDGSVQGQTYIVVSIEINKNGGSFSAGNVALDWNEQPVCNPLTDVTVIT